MLNVIGLSLGSSSRNHQATTELLNKEINVRRMGVDGDIAKAKKTLRELDGTIDAIGLGGIDLYLVSNRKKYVIRQARQLKDCLTKTPIVDGSGLKNTLEPLAMQYLQDHKIIDFKDKKVLMVSAVDRFGMAEKLSDLGAHILFGDLIFGLDIPIPMYKLSTFRFIAGLLLPVVTKMPIKMLYPVGSKQDEKPTGKYSKYYKWADIIAGDFHLIKKHLPDKLPGKIIITNTITEKDVHELAERKLATLITTTPNIGGRSFGTNVLEAMFVSILNKPVDQIEDNDYLRLLAELNYEPRIERLNE